QLRRGERRVRARLGGTSECRGDRSRTAPARHRHPHRYGDRAVKTVAICAMLVGASCAAREPSGDRVTLESLAFEVPTQWHRVDSHLRGVTTSVFTPDTNPRHEAITIIRTERAVAVAHAGDAEVV